MHLLYTDEVNVDPSSTDFFVYGGVAIPGDHAGELSARIDELRSKYTYSPEDPLKFNTVERPTHITPEQHRDIKRDVLLASAEFGVKLFLHVVLHKIAASGPDEARRRGINSICYHFNCYMNWVKDYGLVLIDTFTDDQLGAILREKFQVGVTGLPFSAKYRLDRVLGFHLAAIGSSNFCSVIDIALGAARFAINNRNDERKQQVVSTLLDQLKPLFVYGMRERVAEISFTYSPKTIKSTAFLAEYLALYEFLRTHGIDTDQVPTNERRY